MTTQTATLPFSRPANPARDSAPRALRDVAVAALPLLHQLRDALRAALRFRDRRRLLLAAAPESRWGVPALFYFDAQLQADLERRRPAESDRAADQAARQDPAGAAAWHALVDLLDDALCVLTNSADARHAARAIDGFVTVTQAMRHEHPGVGPLLHVMSVTDDDTVRVVHPAAGVGVRLVVRGVGDVAELHRRLAEVIPGPRWQFLRPDALQADGTMPQGPAGAEHWLWGHESLSALPRIDGDRTVLIDSPERPVTETQSRRRNPVVGELRVVESMGVEAVDAWVAALTGRAPQRRATRRAA